MSDIEKHYSAQELAELLGVSVRTIWTYVENGTRSRGKDGIYPVVKLSHKVVRIPARSVQRFLQSRTLNAAPEA